MCSLHKGDERKRSVFIACMRRKEGGWRCSLLEESGRVKWFQLSLLGLSVWSMPNSLYKSKKQSHLEA